MTGKTSTFIIDHDQCDPSKWTPDNVLAFSRFLRSGGDARFAAALARLGVRIVASEYYEPKGGDMAHLGWALPDLDGEYAETIDDLDFVADVTRVVPIYAGPAQYAVQVPIGNDVGDFEGHEIDLKDNEADARALVDCLQESN